MWEVARRGGGRIRELPVDTRSVFDIVLGGDAPNDECSAGAEKKWADLHP